MNLRLQRQWNERVRPDDAVYFLGDFCCKGKERGVDGVSTKARWWLDHLNGNKVMILGNHDSNNSLQRGLYYGVLEAGGHKILLVHDAYRNKELAPECDVIACGHVHEKWEESWIPFQEDRVRLAVNVGVDVRKGYPVRLDELIGIVSRIKGSHGRRNNPTQKPVE